VTLCNVPEERIVIFVRLSFSVPITVALQAVATDGRMLLCEHPLVNTWTKIGPFQRLCQHTENTNSAISGVVLEPTVPELVSRAAAAMSSALSPSVIFNLNDHTRPKV